MRHIKLFISSLILFAFPCFGQDLRPSAYIGKSGVVTVRGGKIMGSTGGVTNIAGVDITPANSATTYIYLDLSSTPVVASSTSAFPAANYFPICTVIKDANGVITSFTDNRPDSFMAGGGGGSPTNANQIDPTSSTYNVPVGIVSGTPTGTQYIFKSGNDGGSTNTSPTFTSTNQNCSAADIGLLVIIAAGSPGGGAGTYPYGRTLITVTGCNGNAWTLSGNATSTTSNLYWAMGKDAGAGLASAWHDANAQGRHLAIPCGNMLITTDPFPVQAAQNMAIQNQDLTGCSAEMGGSHFFLHPNIANTADGQGAVFAAVSNSFATGTINFNGLSQTATASNFTLDGLGGTWLAGGSTLFANFTGLHDITVMGVCGGAGATFTYATLSVGEAHYSRLNFQAQCAAGEASGGINFAGQGVNIINDSIFAYIGNIPLTCSSTCSYNNLYLTNNTKGISCGAASGVITVTGSNISTIGPGFGGTNGAIIDAGNACTFYVFGNSNLQQTGTSIPAITLTSASSILDISGSALASTTAGCNIAGAGTVNDRVGNSFSSPLNGTGACAFTGKYVPIGGGSSANNTASAATNFGANLGATNVLTAVSPGTASYDVKIGFRQVTAGTTCGAGSNTVTGVLSWTSGGVTFSTGSNGVPALGTLTISANGSVGATGTTNAYVSQPVHIDVGTQITFTTTSVLNSAGCTIVPQYVVDFSTI